MMFKIWMPSEHEKRAGQYITLTKLLMTIEMTGITESLKLSDQDSVMFFIRQTDGTSSILYNFSDLATAAIFLKQNLTKCFWLKKGENKDSQIIFIYLLLLGDLLPAQAILRFYDSIIYLCYGVSSSLAILDSLLGFFLINKMKAQKKSVSLKILLLKNIFWI